MKFGIELVPNMKAEEIASLAVYGNPDQCIEKIRNLFASGVTQVVIGSPIGPDKSSAVKMIGEEIIARVRA